MQFEPAIIGTWLSVKVPVSCSGVKVETYIILNAINVFRRISLIETNLL